MKWYRFLPYLMSAVLFLSILGAASESPGDLTYAGEFIEQSFENTFRILPSMLSDLFSGSKTTEEEEPPEEETEEETVYQTDLYPIETITYLDANKKQKEMITDPFVPRNDYDPDAFYLENGRMTYTGEGYESSVGIDVSYHQKGIDWKRVAASGIEFAIIRVGYRGYNTTGRLVEDKCFRQNLKGAKEAGLLVGVYFFAQAADCEEAQEEADFVLSILDGEPLDLPVVYDPESIKNADARTDHVIREQFTANTRVFCDAVRNAGYDCMIYANMEWQAEKLSMGNLTDIPLWFADYSRKPQSPYAYEIWQYTSHGSVPGISGRVDMNIRLKKGEGNGTDRIDK